jgi:endoglucanase
MKSVLLALLIILTIVTVQAGSIDKNKYPKSSRRIVSINGNSQVQADSIPPDETGMRNLTSLQISKEMVPGWNVGNSLEAIGGETKWGNPLITQVLMDSVSAAGFKSVRIPVAWSNAMNVNTFEIDPSLLTRVEEVVNYVLNSGMYAMINIHWDGGWMQPTYAKQAYVNSRLAALWEQIAVYFRDYNDHLIFAGTNEVMVDGDYGTPTKEYYTVQNSYNQTFVTTVRSTGGCNAYRHLAVQGFNTNINYTISYFTMPYDVVANRLFVEVHYYDPYDFTINSSSSLIQWGKAADNISQTQTWANEPYADAQFQKMKTKFIDNGHGVLLGEYCAMARLNLGNDALNALHAKNRKYYIEYITYSLIKHGLVPMYWDAGFTGDKGSGLFYRNSGTQAYTEIIKSIMNVVDTTIFPLDVEMSNPVMPTMFSLSQNYPNPFNPTTTIQYSLPVESHVQLVVFDILGRQVAITVNGVKNAGFHSVIFDGAHLASGFYFASCIVKPTAKILDMVKESDIETIKMLLTK